MAQAVDGAGRIIFFAPITAGSEKDPLPIGRWTVKAIVENPTFHYNPDLFWDAEPNHAKAKLPAGPNSPVGVVWIDLDKEHYGLHGNPEPSQVGRAESHGCVSLTNWDASRLAGAGEGRNARAVRGVKPRPARPRLTRRRAAPGTG